MELLSRHGDYVTAGCKDCRVSVTLPTPEWDAAKAKREADWRAD